MLVQLPLEHVQHIVRLTLPSSSSPLDYRARQDTLLALCATSKALCDIAQPVLLEVVELTSGSRVNSFLGAVKEGRKGDRVQVLRLSGDDECDYKLSKDALFALASDCRNVAEVRLCDFADVELNWLEAFESGLQFFYP
jgi:hypothetical protein